VAWAELADTRRGCPFLLLIGRYRPRGHQDEFNRLQRLMRSMESLPTKRENRVCLPLWEPSDAMVGAVATNLIPIVHY
jgi:hypothetical protein